MKKKQYKVKVENGQIVPQEPIDLSKFNEGLVIFLDEELGIFTEQKDNDLTDAELLQLADKNPAFDFLKDKKEDIYSALSYS